MRCWKYGLLAVLIAQNIALGQSERWIPLASTHKFRVQLDTKTIAEDTGIVTAWVQGRHTGDAGTDTLQTSYAVINRDKYACMRRAIAPIMATRYDAYGNHVSDSVSKWSEWQDVIPGTIQEGIFEGVCDYAKEHNLIHPAGFLDRDQGPIIYTIVALALVFAFGAGIGWASSATKARWMERRIRQEAK